MPPALGYSFGVGGRAAKRTIAGPAGLTLGGWWPSVGVGAGDGTTGTGYHDQGGGAGTWYGALSRGTSHLLNLAEATNAPAADVSDLLGHYPAYFADGVDYLRYGNGFSTYSSDIFSNDSFSFWVLININSITISDPNPSIVDCIFEDAGEAFGLTLDANGGGGNERVRFYITDPGYNIVNETVALGTWQLIQGAFSSNGAGGEKYLRINDGTWQTNTVNAEPNIRGGVFSVGCDGGGNYPIDATIAEIGVAKEFYPNDSSVWTMLRSYCLTNYGVTV